MKPLLFIFSLIVLASCSRPTCVTRSWVKAGTDPVVHDNILVVALVGKGKSYVQKSIEEDVAADINSKGYHAVSYYDQYGAVNLGKESERSIVKNLRNGGEDAILTISLLDTTMRNHFVSSDASFENLDQMNTRFIGYFQAPYVPSYSKRYEPGYDKVDINYFWHAKLYTPVSQSPIYAATITSADPGNTDELALQYSKAIVKDMEDKAILLKPKIKRIKPASKPTVAVK